MMLRQEAKLGIRKVHNWTEAGLVGSVWVVELKTRIYAIRLAERDTHEECLEFVRQYIPFIKWTNKYVAQ